MTLSLIQPTVFCNILHLLWHSEKVFEHSLLLSHQKSPQTTASCNALSSQGHRTKHSNRKVWDQHHMIWPVLCVSVCSPLPSSDTQWTALFLFMTHPWLFIFKDVTAQAHAYDNMHLQCQCWLKKAVFVCVKGRKKTSRSGSVTATETNSSQ